MHQPLQVTPALTEMHLDGIISRNAGFVFLGALLVGVVILIRKGGFGYMDPDKHQRDRTRIPFVSSWNYGDPKRWTAEGIAFMKNQSKWSVRMLIWLLLWWLILDALTS